MGKEYYVEGISPRLRSRLWMFRNLVAKVDDVYSIDRAFRAFSCVMDRNIPVLLPSYSVYMIPSAAEADKFIEVPTELLLRMPWQDSNEVSEKTYSERMSLAQAAKERMMEVLDGLAREPSAKAPYTYAEEAFKATPLEVAFLHRLRLLGEISTWDGVPSLLRSVSGGERKDETLQCMIGMSAEDMAQIREGQLRELGLLTFNDDASRPFPFKDSNAEKARVELHPLFTSALDKLPPDADSMAAMLSGRRVEVDDTLLWEDFTHLGELRDVAAAYLRADRGGSVLLVGPPGTGKTEFAAVLSRQVGIPMFSVGETHEGGEPTRHERFACLKTAVAVRRGGSALLLDEAEDLLQAPDGATDRFKFSKAHLNRFLDTLRVPVIWTTNSVRGIDPATLRRMGMVIPFDAPGVEVRRRIWARTLEREGVEDADAHALARDWKAPAGLCVTAARTATASGLGAKALEPVLDGFSRVLDIRTRPEGDAGNFDPRLCQCDEDLASMTTMLAEAPSPRWSLCLWGPPGTGKSAYARHVAHQMGMEVLLKRASDLLDKYVGGTEANIAEAFAQARRERRLLIIDEADSMLASREGANQSWEVTQVNEMLTQMEAHPLPFVATTNLMDRLDRASLRRFTFKMRFDHMSRERARLAFEHILGLELPARLELPDDLAPGDIAPMRRRMDILGVRDAARVVAWLREEVVLKGGTRRNPLGFGG